MATMTMDDAVESARARMAAEAEKAEAQRREEAKARPPAMAPRMVPPPGLSPLALADWMNRQALQQAEEAAARAREEEKARRLAEERRRAEVGVPPLYPFV
jgi:hypothetical protein